MLLGGLAGFSAYFAMYAFRKPFTAATYDNPADWGLPVDFKVALVIAQVVGYALSKAIGVKFVSELGRSGRAAAILGLVGMAWLALVAFALAPPELKVAAMFLNGLPLGLIWGLVFSYLEGRRVTEALGAVLCASFILSSGVVKSVGAWLIHALAVPEFWMPAATGAVFFPILALSTWGLAALPPPNAEDEAARMPRAPMAGRARWRFLRRFGMGLLFLISAYVLFTAARDFRDNFSAELWRSLGRSGDAAVFSLSEGPVAGIALLVLAGMMAIRSNRAAFMITHGVMAAGAALIGASTVAFQFGGIGPLPWMILSGAGLYVCYTPYNAVLFERLIAASRTVGAAGFLIYLADTFGYAGSVGLPLFKTFAAPQLDWLGFFVVGAYATSVVGLVLVVASAFYFRSRLSAPQFRLAASGAGDALWSDRPLRPFR